MARKQLVVTCSSCDAPLRSDSAFCPDCGRPTVWATHDERVAWEVRQWRASRARGAASSVSSTMTMLVRTEEGYAPTEVNRTDFVWDQPLHPERETPVIKNPHAAPPMKSGMIRGGGHSNVQAPEPRPEPLVKTEVATEITGLEGVELAPSAPPRSELAPEAEQSIVSPPVEAIVERPAPRSVVAPEAPDAGVSISKKAVAVGIALAVGLPLSGRALNLTGGKPATVRPPAAVVAGGPARPVALVVARSGFSKVSPDAERYAVVVGNANPAYTARGITVSISFLDAAGRLVGTAVERLAVLPAGGRVAVAGQTAVAGPVARLVTRVSASAFEGGRSARPFVVRGVRMSHSGGRVVVQAAISGATPVRDARIVVVHFDRAGRIIGGDFTYVDVPRSPAAATAVISTTGVAGVARVEIYVSASH